MFSFPKIICNNVSLSITIAVWTIVQTFIHVYGLLYVQFWRNCRLDNGGDFFHFLFGSAGCNFNSTDIDDNFKKELNSELWLTEQLDKFIIVYIIFDTIWLVTSVGLLTGACCIIREIWALVFYLPWVVMNIIILIYDVVCTIYFGAHVSSNGSFLNWFNFFGITNKISDIQDLENGSIEMVVGAASIIMTFVSCRAVVIWIVNLIFLIFIIKIARKEFNTKYDQYQYEKRERIENGDCERKIKKPEKEEKPIVRTNSQRIRDWHRFYDTTRYTKEKMHDDNDSVEETFYDCIDEKDLIEARNYMLNDAAKKNELLLSVRAFEQSVPSTSKATCVDLSFSEAYGEPSTSSNKKMFRIVTHDYGHDHSESEANFNSSNKDFPVTQNISK